MSQAIAIIIVVGVLLTVLIVGFYFNKKTPKPEGCDDIECLECKNTFCQFNKKQKDEDKEQENKEEK